MPGTTPPGEGLQAFWAVIKDLGTRLTNLEVWQRQVTPLPNFVRFGAVTLTYPGGQGYTNVANITPNGGPTGTCFAVASCQTDSTGQGRSVATISTGTAACFVNANTIDGSNPAGGTTVLVPFLSWALS